MSVIYLGKNNMTHKLEEILDLPANEEIENIRKALHEQNDKIEKQAEETEQLSTAMTPMTEKALATIQEREDRVNQIIDLKKFDDDTEDLFKESMEAFREIMSIAKDMPAPSMGKAFESAAIFARIALDAKNSKVKARLDSIDIALKKKRIDLVENKKDDENEPVDVSGSFVDRNQLLKSFREALKEENKEEKPK
jgi:hypothetical protein